MYIIREYNITGGVTGNGKYIDIPVNAKILSAISIGRSILVYALVEKNEKVTDSYKFCVYQSEKDIEEDLDEFTYLGCELRNTTNAYHVFYKKEEW